MRDSSLRRDVRVIGLIGAAHFFSHFFQLSLPPLFPLLKPAFDVSYLALGVTMSVFYAASGVGQTLSGFLVDRAGALRVLLSGMALLSAAITLAGLVPAYWMLLPVALLAGLGNSVFHPADYSILNVSVDPRRIGRGYSVHSISGNLGYAVAPTVVVSLATSLSWRIALCTVGVVGLAVVLVLATQREARLIMVEGVEIEVIPLDHVVAILAARAKAALMFVLMARHAVIVQADIRRLLALVLAGVALGAVRPSVSARQLPARLRVLEGLWIPAH